MTAEKQKEEHLALKNERMKMTNKLLKFAVLAGVIFIALIVIGIAFAIWKNSPSQTEISSYPIKCEKTNTDGSCVEEVALPKLTFKVNANLSSVVMITNGTITQLSSCTIIDLKNWECDIPNYDNLDYASVAPSSPSYTPTPYIPFSSNMPVSQQLGIITQNINNTGEMIAQESNHPLNFSNPIVINNILSLGFTDGQFSMSAPASSKLGAIINSSKLTFVTEQEWLGYPAPAK